MRFGKVPVFRSVGAGYLFFAKNFGRILRVAWFPGLLLIGFATLAAYLSSDLKLLEEGTGWASVQDYSAWSSIWSLFGVFEFVALLVIGVGLYRVALEPDMQIGFAYFRFGETEIRVFLISILIVLFSVLVFLLLFLFGAIGLGTAASLVPESNSIVDLSMMLGSAKDDLARIVSQRGSTLFWLYVALACFIMFWIWVRFLFAVPAIIEHRRAGMRFVWSVTRGNALRLTVFSILLVISLIILAFSIFFTLALGAGILIGIVQIAGGFDPGSTTNQTVATMDQFFSQMSTTMQLGIYALQVFLNYFVQLLIAGVFIGGTVFAYRAALEGHEGAN